MLQIARILAPTDFSHHAEAALRFACGLAERFESELHLLHVLSEVVVPAGPDPMLIPSMPPEFYAETENLSLQTLANLVQDDWPKPSEVATQVRWGDAVEEINTYASEQAIDLIVIATHGRTGLSHMLLGSVAERIVREAPCPVLTIRNK